MKNQITVAQALERARGLLSYLVEHRDDCAPSGAGARQLQNMAVHVTNIEEWVASEPADPTNAVKRLRDFSNTIERLKVPDDSATDTRNACQELIESFRFAAEQLDVRKADSPMVSA
jgi:hypothetical protein